MTRSTFTLEVSLAERARALDINISAAAREGVARAVARRLAERDRDAYRRHPESGEHDDWADARAWTSP